MITRRYLSQLYGSSSSPSPPPWLSFDYPGPHEGRQTQLNNADILIVDDRERIVAAYKLFVLVLSLGWASIDCLITIL